MILASILLVVATADSGVADSGVADGDMLPSTMTNASIAEHNATLDKADPAFIRCRRLEIPGSLVKKARVCRTNAGWAKVWSDGNQNARDTYDAMNRGSSNSIEPADEFTKRTPRPN